MQLKRVVIRVDDRDRRPEPPEPQGNGLLETLRDCFDGATHGLRRAARSRLDHTRQALESGQVSGLSDAYREAAVDRMIALRSRIIAGGPDGVLASGRALIECAWFRPA